nr:GH27226p [Drosophila melanogaster]
MSRRTKVGSIARQSSNQTFGERARIPSFLQNDAARGRHAGNLSPGAECKVSASSDLLFHANSDSIRGFPRRLGSSLWRCSALFRLFSRKLHKVNWA